MKIYKNLRLPSITYLKTPALLGLLILSTLLSCQGAKNDSPSISPPTAQSPENGTWNRHPAALEHKNFFKLQTSAPGKQLLCSEVSDHFCRILWNNKHKGNLRFGAHNIFYGLSHDLASTEIQRINAQALIQSEQRLPPDIRVALSQVMKKFKRQLSQGSDTTRWRHALNLIQLNIDQILYQVAEERGFKEFPALRQLPVEDREIKEKMQIKKHVLAVQSEVLDAKYLTHKNWLRTIKLFKLAQNFLIQGLKGLDIPPPVKKIMLRQLTEIELILPYGDKNKIGASSGCRHHSKNAFYFPRLNRITICAGYFNGLQSDASLFSILAHEMAHATDGSRLASLHFKRTALARGLNHVSQNHGQLKCGEWSQLKKSIFVKPKEIFKLPARIMKLNACHVDRSGLKPLTIKSLSGPATTKAQRNTSAKARHYDFSKIILPTKLKYGEEVENPYYLHPELLDAALNQKQTVQYENGYFYFPGIFLQIYKCAAEEAKTSISGLITQKPQRQKIFKASLEEVRRLYKIYKQTKYSFYGRESRELLNFKLSKVSFEDWADWISYEALSLYLNRSKSLENQRWDVLSVTARRCSRNDISILAPLITQSEREFSNAVHSQKRTRRLRVFTKKIATLLKCSRKDLGPTCQF